MKTKTMKQPSHKATFLVTLLVILTLGRTGEVLANDEINRTAGGGVEGGPGSLSLGNRHGNGDDNDNCQTSGDTDPVELLTGEFLFGRTDLVLPGFNESLVIDFQYRSQRMYNSHWGYGWYFPLEQRLYPLVDGTMMWRLGTGEEVVFTLHAGGSGYDAPVGHHVTLDSSANGGHVIRERTGYIFEFSSEGLILSMQNPAGNILRFEWDQEAGGGAHARFPISGHNGQVIALDYRISRIVGFLSQDLGAGDNQFVDFAYFGASDGNRNGRLKDLTDSYGRITSYDYNSAGDLIQVQSPLVESVQGGTLARRVTSYEYSTGFQGAETGAPLHRLDHNLLTVRDDRGQSSGEPVLVNVYNSRDQVVQQSMNGADTFIAYTGDTKRVVTNGNGFQTQYNYVAGSGLPSSIWSISPTVHTSTIPSVPTTTYTYNANGELDYVTLAGGDKIDYDRNAANGFTNSVDHVQKNGSAAFSTSSTYEPILNQLRFATDELGNVTEYVYDTLVSDRVLKIKYSDVQLPDGSIQSGQETDFGYNGHGQLSLVTDPLGKQVSYVYYLAGHVHYGRLKERIVDPAGFGLTTMYDYDAHGFLSTMTDPEDHIFHYTNNSLGEALMVEGPQADLGNGPAALFEVQMAYDGSGNLTGKSIVDRDHSGVLIGNIQTDYAWDTWSRLTSITGEYEPGATRTSSFVYDGMGNVIERTTPEGRISRYTYDERNLLHTTTHGAGTADAGTWTLDRNASGRVVASHDPDGRTTDYVYDNWYRLKEVHDADGNVTLITLNDRGDLMGQERRESLSGATISASTFVVDNWGRTFRIHQLDSTGALGTRSTEFWFHPNGLLEHSVGFRGQQTAFEYDTANRLDKITDPVGNLIEYSYDLNGNVKRIDETENAVAGTEVYATEFEYDELNRRITTEQLGSLTSGPNSLTWTYHYDSRSNLRQVIDPIARTTEYQYDLASRLKKQILDVGGTPEYARQFTYDLDSMPLDIEDADGLHTSSAFDARGRLTRRTYPATGGNPPLSESYTYDRLGALTSHRAQDGLLTSYTYHPDLTLDTRSAQNRTEAFTWNALGQPLTAAVTENGTQTSNLSFLYDGWNRLTHENGQAGGNLQHGYDLDGNPTSCTYPGGDQFACSYDSLNRMDVGTWNGAQLVDYDYTGPARRHMRTTGAPGSQQSQQSQWDGHRRLVGLDSGAGHDLAYGYDDLSRRTYKEYEHSTTGARGDVYRHDRASRLTEVLSDSPTPASNAGGSSTVYELSKETSRLSVTGQGSYNSSSVDELHRYTDVGGVVRSYDERGNLTSDGSYAYSYDPWNHLREVSDGATGDMVLRWQHDAFGRRSLEERSVASGEAAKRFVYAGPRLLEEQQDSGGTWNTSVRYIHGAGLDEILAIESGGGLHHVFQDALGSVELITTPAGIAEERYEYDAFGMVEWVKDGAGLDVKDGQGRWTSALGNNRWYTGSRWDRETGQFHMRARQYEPGTGQFASRDPLGYVDGPNAYMYGFANPVDWLDPFGLEGDTGMDPGAYARNVGGLEEANGRYTHYKWGPRPKGLSPGGLGDWQQGEQWRQNLYAPMIGQRVRRGSGAWLAQAGWVASTHIGGAVLAIPGGILDTGKTIGDFSLELAALAARKSGLEQMHFNPAGFSGISNYAASEFQQGRSGSFGGMLGDAAKSAYRDAKNGLAGDPEAAGRTGGLIGEAALAALSKKIVGKLRGGKVCGSDGVDLTDPRGRNHILDGDGPGRGGGHRPGTGKPGKSEFPDTWSDDDILDAISDIATDPNVPWSRPDRRGYITGSRTVRGVDVKVVFDTVNDRIVTGFPTNLPRNP